MFIVIFICFIVVILLYRGCNVKNFIIELLKNFFDKIESIRVIVNAD